ncbi:MAG: carbohydrate porin [Planctomycetota bacterium]
MGRIRYLSYILYGLGIVCCFAGAVSGFDGAEGTRQQGVWDFVGLQRDILEDSGVDVGAFFYPVYQQNVHGGLSQKRRTGRTSGSYDLELTADFERLLSLERTEMYVLVEGSCSKGIDESSVGSFFGVNGGAAGDNAISVSELWVEHVFAGDFIHLRIGKLDLTHGFVCNGLGEAFDASLYANNENTQFLNNSLINNPTIPFPDFGLGFAVHLKPVDFFYLSAGMADARSDGRSSGFSTTFDDPDFFYIVESGVTGGLDFGNGPLQGLYHIGLWYDPQDKVEFSRSSSRCDDVGFYVGFDQMLYKESSDNQDEQGLGMFSRYGWASGKVYEVTNFWSVGFAYQGLLAGRDDDVAAIGFGQGIFSSSADSFTEDSESVFEFYYSIRFTEWMSVSPSVQHIVHPGGDKSISDATIIGVRAQFSF